MSARPECPVSDTRPAATSSPGPLVRLGSGGGLRAGAVPVLAATVVLGLCLEQLLIAPVVALANNGDFDRLLAMIGLRSTGPRFAVRYAWLHYSVGHTHAPDGRYLTSYLAAAGPLSAIARLLPGGAFDSRILATVLTAALAVCVYLVVKAIPGQAARVAASAALVIGLCDARLVAYLDSWYDEPWSLLMLLGLTAWLLHNRGARTVPPRRVTAFVAIAALLVTAKTQDAALAVPIATAVLVVTRRPGRDLASRLRPAVAPCLLLAALGVTFFAAQPPAYANQSRYDLIFDDLLVHVHDPAATLNDLGLPAAMKTYAGTNAYQPGSGYHSAAFTHFEANHPTVRLALYYASHPTIAADAIARGLRAGWQAALPYLGYRTQSSGARPWAGGCGSCAYSDLTGAASPAGVPLTICLYGAALLLAALARRGSLPGVADALICLCAISATALIVAVFGEGHYEETKHLYLFYTGNLLLLALSLGVTSDLVAKWVTARTATPRSTGAGEAGS